MSKSSQFEEGEMSDLEDVRKWSEDAARFAEEHCGTEVAEQFNL